MGGVGETLDTLSVPVHTAAENDPPVSRSYYLPIIICVSSTLFLALTFLCGHFVLGSLVHSKSWFLDEPSFGVPLYLAVFTVGSALFLPYSPFCIAVGYIWGFWPGWLVQASAIFISSAFIYGVGQVLLKDRVLAFIRKRHEKWLALIEHIGSNLFESCRLNILLCFIPMPYGTHAYIFSLSECPMLLFALGFEVGMLGHTYLNLSIGRALALSAELGIGESDYDILAQMCISAASVLGMFMAIWYGGVVTRRILSQGVFYADR